MFKKPIVVLISGKAFTGKTTSAKYLVDVAKKKNLITGIYPFADSLKSMARLMGWDGKKDDRGRKFLQDLGKAGRAYDIDMWAKKTLRKIENDNAFPPDIVFIDDWRFPNELKFFEESYPYCPVTIRVIAPNRELLKGKPEYNDESETSLDYMISDDFDFTLNNALTYQDLYSQLDSFWVSVESNIDKIYKRGEN